MTPGAEALMRAFEPDLCVMAYVTLFVPQAVVDAPTKGTIQYHPSLLPLHRGPSSINWPIIMGRQQTGLTIFWPDEGLDEGHVLLARKSVVSGKSVSVSVGLGGRSILKNKNKNLTH